MFRRACTSVFVLIVLSIAFPARVAAQGQGSIPPASDADRGFLSRLEFGGSSNTLGQEFVLDGSAGYQFNKHVALTFGLPLYITHASATATTTSSTVSGIGDPSMMMLLRFPNETVNYATSLTTMFPLASASKGLSTGRVGIDWNNRFDHDFGRVTPFFAAGMGNTIMDSRFFHRPFTTLGFNAHFEGGADLDIGHKLSAGASGYDIAPSGQQKVFSRIVEAGNSGSQGKHGAFGSAHQTTGTSSLTADHGFATWIDANPTKLLDMELGFSRSMVYDLNTVSFTIGLNLGQMVRENSRH